MAYNGIAIALTAVTGFFFYLYQSFRNREGDESWVRIINDNLASLFFGMGIIMIDVIIYTAWLYAGEYGSPLDTLAPVLKPVMLTIVIISIIVGVVILLKTALVFLQLFFSWAIRKVGLMK